MIQKSTLTVLVGAFFLSNAVFAQPAAQGPHSHGAAEARIAIEGKKGKLEFDVPASAIYGFEHEAKTKADKLRKDRGLQLLQDKIGEMFSFAENLKCEIKLDVYEVEQKKNHADVQTEFNVECAEPLKGSELVVSVQKHFPKIKKLQIQLVVDDVQKSVEVLKDGEKIGLQ